MVAYAGMPLTTADGQTLGAFCAVDSAPRTWSDDDLSLLRGMADQVMAAIDGRAQQRQPGR